MSDTTKVLSESTLREFMSLIVQKLNEKSDVGHSHNLGELLDVDLKNLKDGNAIQWNASSGKWEVGDIQGLFNALTEEEIVRLWRYAFEDIDGNSFVTTDMLETYAKLLHGHSINDIDGAEYLLQEDIDDIYGEVSSGGSGIGFGLIGDYVESVAGKTGIVSLDITDITDLSNILDEKSELSHTHIISDIDGAEYLESADIDTLYGEMPSGTAIVLSNYVKSVAGRTGDIILKMSDIGNLVETLANKSNINHIHEISDINELENRLNELAKLPHTHIISDISGLEERLNNLSNNPHTHEIDDILNLTDALLAKSNVGHKHEISEITNLQNILNLKAELDHDHVIGDIEGATYLDTSSIDEMYGKSGTAILNDFVTSVAGKTGDVILRVADISDIDTVMNLKSDISHKHSMNDIEGLQEALDGKANTTDIADIYDLLNAENTMSEDDVNNLWNSN